MSDYIKTRAEEILGLLPKEDRDVVNAFIAQERERAAPRARTQRVVLSAALLVVGMVVMAVVGNAVHGAVYGYGVAHHAPCPACAPQTPCPKAKPCPALPPAPSWAPAYGANGAYDNGRQLDPLDVQLANPKGWSCMRSTRTGTMTCEPAPTGATPEGLVAP